MLVPILFGAGQPMIVLTRMSDGRSSSSWAALIAARSGVEVVDVVDRLHVPAVGLEAPGDVLAVEAQRRRAVERDRVVVVHVDHAPEPELAGERRRLRRDALHEVAVGADDVRAVVLHLCAVALTQEALGHRQADAVGEALAQRAGRDLDARRDVDAVALGVARRDRAPLPELLDVVQRDVVAGQVQRRVQPHRAVARAEHEPVPIRPRRILRVVVHDLAEEDVRERRHRHRHPGVAGVRCLRRRPWRASGRCRSPGARDRWREGRSCAQYPTCAQDLCDPSVHDPAGGADRLQRALAVAGPDLDRARARGVDGDGEALAEGVERGRRTQ